MEDKPFWFSLDRHLPEPVFARKVAEGSAYVALMDGTPAGLLRYNLFWDNTPFCNLLMVKEGCRGLGLGTQLMTFWEKEMKTRGYGMVLTSTQADESAQHFYRKLGYRDCGSLTIDIPLCAQPMELFLLKPL